MRVAVIGLGSIGLRHSRNVLSLGGNVIGFDPNPDRRRLLEAAGGRAAETREAALEQADAAVIASPSAHHESDLASVVEAGLDAFVEKPLATSLDGVEAVLEAAEKSGRIVFVGFNLRFHPCIHAAMKLLQDRQVGELCWTRWQASSYLPDWRKGQDHRVGYASDPVSGGVIFDTIHEVDLALHLVGDGRTTAAAARCSGTLGIPSDDVAVLVIQHVNNVLSSIHMDYLTRPPRRCAEIAGTRGVLELDLLARSLVLRDETGDVVLHEEFDGSFDDDYVSEMTAFLARLRGEDAVYCDGWEALKSLRAVMEARSLSGLPPQ